MKITIKIKAILLISLITFCYGQDTDSSVLYQKAINTIDGDKALEMYEQIIQLNDNSDYYWLSILKKAELSYAIGSYIQSAKLLKQFNVNAPSHLVTDISKGLLYKALTVVGEIKTAKEYQKKLNKPIINQKKVQSNKTWFIQFGAFENKENAITLKNALNETGILDIAVTQAFNRGKMIYYVRSKGFKSYASASKEATQLKRYDSTFAIVGY